ncbi:MAG: hemolysin family protein [Gemmatimonadaceae bacterium]|nr:hemolysin family protein [Gemmatimonadaceae bacterium]
MTELVVAVALAVGFSAMCSLFEAVLYSVPVGHVEAMAESGQRTGRILRSLRERVDRPISAILSLNTIANTAGAAWAGAAFVVVFDDERLWLFSAAFTLAILLFSEVIPKTAGVVYCRGLAGPVARPLLAMVWVFRPLIWLTGQVTRLIARDQGFPGVSEEELLVMARLGRKEGAIDADEAAAIENILGLKEKTVRDIMTPRTVVFSLAVSSTLGQVRDSAQSLNHTRVPVYDSDADDVVGTVHRQDLLAAMAEGEWDRALEELMRPVDFVADALTADRLLRRLLESRQHLVMVIDEFGSLAGLVTLEDVLEEILGTEIVDEFDPAEDMRELAHRRRSQSLGDPGQPS